MARWATQKGMKKVRCSRFSVVPFSNLIRLRRMNTERIFVGVPHGALRHPESNEKDIRYGSTGILPVKH